jgi:hypothetical protein
MLSTRHGLLQQPPGNRTPFDPQSGRTELRAPSGEARLFRCACRTGVFRVRSADRRNSHYLGQFCGAYHHQFELRDGLAPCGHPVESSYPVRPVNGRLPEISAAEIARWRVQIRERLAEASDAVLREFQRGFRCHPQLLPDSPASAAFSFLCLAEGMERAQEWMRNAAAIILENRKEQVAA